MDTWVISSPLLQHCLIWLNKQKNQWMRKWMKKCFLNFATLCRCLPRSYVLGFYELFPCRTLRVYIQYHQCDQILSLCNSSLMENWSTQWDNPQRCELRWPSLSTVLAPKNVLSFPSAHGFWKYCWSPKENSSWSKEYQFSPGREACGERTAPRMSLKDVKETG